MRARILVAMVSTALPALSITTQSTADSVNSERELVLAVRINDYDVRELLLVRQTADGQFLATVEDLKKAGIDPGKARPNPQGLVRFSDLKGVTYRFDEPAQRIDIQADDAARMAYVVNAGSRSQPIDWGDLQSHPSATFNYTLYGGSEFDWDRDANSQWISSAFDARFSSSLGVVSSSAVVRISDFDRWDRGSNEFVRLDSAWEYFNPEDALGYRMGDAISSSPLWGTSYRLGGIQFGRNFGIRPDLVTAAVPEFSGSAAVPSSLDIYLDNVRVFSGDVPSGPFEYSSMPYLSGGGGAARIVMRDELGREVITEVPYYIMPGLLREGVLDFSVEAGLPRKAYGIDSFEYTSRPVASASARYGFPNQLTGEVHFKTYDGFVNGGAGLIAGLGGFGGIHLGLSGSNYRGNSGGKIYTRYQGNRERFSFYAGTERTIGDYLDIGTLLSRADDEKVPVSARAHSIDRAGASFPLGFDSSSLSIGWTRIGDAGQGDDGHYLNASWSRTVAKNMFVYTNAYGKTDGSGHYGVFAGLTFLFGGQKSASVDAFTDKDGLQLGASVTQSAGREEGSVGWAVRSRRNADGDGYLGASGSYRTAPAQLSASIEQSGSRAGRITATVDGSIVAAGGGVFAANRVDDSFVVANVGAPGVDVTMNGRRIATSGRNGRALIPYLESFRRNRVGLDPINLPLELQADITSATVIPNYRSGVVVDFGVRNVQAATLIVTRTDNTPIPVGSVAAPVGTIENSVAGYDGEIYLTGLKSGRNEVVVTMPGGENCRAVFDYASEEGPQQQIGPLQCQ